jgi:hypothetical protein
MTHGACYLGYLGISGEGGHYIDDDINDIILRKEIKEDIEDK